jgi:hypothetical protein
MSKPLFRKTTTEFTKNDVIDVLLISGLAIVTWELGRRIRNAKRALLDTKYWGDLKWEDHDWDDQSDEPISFMPTFVDKLLPNERGLCNSTNKVTDDLCIKPEGHAGTHVAKVSDFGPEEYSWQDWEQINNQWMCGDKKPNKSLGYGQYTCTRNKDHDGAHCNGYWSWLSLHSEVVEVNQAAY